MRIPRLVCLTLLFSACLSPDVPPGAREDVQGEVSLHALLIEDFLIHAPVIPCQRRPGPGAVRSVTPVGMEDLLALSEDGRSVFHLDGDLRALAIRSFSRGPSDPLDPGDAWLLGDSLLVVADGRGRALHLWSWGNPGSEGERIPLPFVPHRLVPLDGGVGVVPLGGAGGSLLHRWDRAGLTELGITPPSLGDPRLSLLAGALVSTVSSSGEVFLAHPLLVPTIHRVTGTRVETGLLPIPDGQERAVGRIPRPPFEEEEILDMLAPALDLAPGAAGSILVLTRSGALRRGVREKAIVRLDRTLQAREGGRLPVNLVLLARQDARGHVTGMDPAGRWHRCGPLVLLPGGIPGGSGVLPPSRPGIDPSNAEADPDMVPGS
jgi:hypothetical protein